MAHQVVWTKVVLEEFIRLGGLTKEEEMIIRTRCAGWSRTKQANEFHMSLSSIDRIIKRLKIKYDRVQPHSCLLPPRKFSAEETYMDTH